MTEVVVVGSVNMDLTAHLERWPQVGETVTARRTTVGLGGKGANQAVAAARLGADVALIGAVGADGFGQQLVRRLMRAGLELALETVGDADTGMAFIDVGPEGGNIIRLAPGANATLTAKNILRHAPVIAKAKVLLLQNEIPLKASLQAAQIAQAHGVQVIMDPAPAPSPAWDRNILSHFDIITPNAHETARIAGRTPRALRDAEAVARHLTTLGPQSAIVTMGRLGVGWNGPQSSGRQAAPAVDARDTVGAGDCFNGALAVALAQGRNMSWSIAFAADVAALAVTRSGPADAAPSLADVALFQSSRAVPSEVRDS